MATNENGQFTNGLKSSVETPTDKKESLLVTTGKYVISDREKNQDLSVSKPPSPVSFAKLAIKEHNMMEKCQDLICGRSFVKYASRKEIMNWVERQDANIFQQKCYICKELFSNNEQYEEHTEPKAYECPYCSKEFCNKVHAYYHIILHHLKKHKGKRYPCQDCGISYKKEASLRRHAVLHWDEESRRRSAEIWNNECNICHRKFFNLVLLNTHIYMNHSTTVREEKPYECSNCDEGYRSENERLKHEITKHFAFRRP